ncbi:rhomboid family intramembrane serine protease [Kordia sp.]|uniref:rhomboid family intramembrane serine protease n=1 Tax=Kordia sp. TaxID=1965332 RepID=UPI0025C3F2FA|nr:rhomboid family intramembrane serine protease [Kordia sp.]MCH2194909.1 rhomboid family intramembrane serine protease [Kordia sp.]
MIRITETVKHLIIINVLLWIATFVLQERGIDLNVLLSLHFPENNSFEFWQPITSMFMHSLASPAHLLFNMLGLWMFGSALEMRWGKMKFLSFYMITGVGAGLVHTLVNYVEFYSLAQQVTELNLSTTQIKEIINVDMVSGQQYLGKLLSNELPSILTKEQLLFVSDASFTAMFHMNILNQTVALGASGALYGILVAFGMMYPNTELMLLFLPIPIKAKYFIPGLLLLDFIGGITGGLSLFGAGQIAHFAHLGGALFGFLLMWYFNKTQFNKNRWN